MWPLLRYLPINALPSVSGGTLDVHARTRQLGEVFIAPADVALADNNVVQPDIFFISAARLEALTADGRRIAGAPDLVVEILSPSTAADDRGDKCSRTSGRSGIRSGDNGPHDRRRPCSATRFLRQGRAPQRSVDRPRSAPPTGRLR